ncbi:unnamed protein product, partial [Porites evermanni]
STPFTSAASEGFRASPGKAVSRDLRLGLKVLGHVSCMQDGRIPKNVLYGELCHWNQTCRGPPRRFIEVCKRDLKAGNINPAAWEAVAVDRSHRRLAFKESTLACEEWNEAQTAVGSISTHRAIHGIHLQQLQQSLPIQNRIVPQPQKALQLNH